MRSLPIAILFACVLGCGRSEVEEREPLEPVTQRERAVMQITQALEERAVREFQTHYDWDDEHRVTADWKLEEGTTRGEPSAVVITVPKEISEANVAAAAGNAVGADPPLDVFRHTTGLFPELLGQAMEYGAARSSGYRGWEFRCSAEDSTESEWVFAVVFSPVAEGFHRDETAAEVQPAETPEPAPAPDA